MLKAKLEKLWLTINIKSIKLALCCKKSFGNKKWYHTILSAIPLFSTCLSALVIIWCEYFLITVILKGFADFGQKWMCVSVSAEWVWGNWFTQGDRLWGTEDIPYGERIYFRKTRKKSGIALPLTDWKGNAVLLWIVAYLRETVFQNHILELKNSLFRDIIFLYF